MAGIAIIFESYLDAIEDLPDEEQLALYRAISRYSIRDEEPELTGMAKTIFKVMRPTIDANKDKSAQARELANKRWSKNKNTAYDTTHDATHDAHAHAHTDAHDAERKCNVGNGKDSELSKVRNGRDLENKMIKDNKGDESLECVMLSGQEAATEHQKWTKRPYGEFQNVHLSAEDARKLATKFPTDWQERIEALSIHKQSTGRKYKDDYATILNWDRYDRQKEKSKEQLVVKPNSAEGMKRSMDMMKEWLEQSELEDKEKEETEDT